MIANDQPKFHSCILLGHSNDPAAHVQDILAYNEAVEVAKKYVDKLPNTILISTSDHETGGLSVAKQLSELYPEYKWNPEALDRIKNSTEVVGRYLASMYPDGAPESVIKRILADWLDIRDPTPNELEWLKSGKKSALQYDYFLGPMVSNRALLGWSTHGHSAIDVGLYAYGAGAERLKGNRENTDIGSFLAQYLRVNLNGVTAKLLKARQVCVLYDRRRSTPYLSLPIENDSQPIWHTQPQIMSSPPFVPIHHHSKDQHYMH